MDYKNQWAQIHYIKHKILPSESAYDGVISAMLGDCECNLDVYKNRHAIIEKEKN